MAFVDWATGLSSFVLRVAAYVFLRWIPGHNAPPAIYTAFAVYVSSFLYQLVYTSPYKVIADEIDIISTEISERDGDDGEASDPDPSVAKQREDEPVVEIEVKETIIEQEKETRPLRTLLSGIPSPTSGFWTGMTFLINLALVLMTVDLVYRAPNLYPSHRLSFARVGYVADDYARVLVREPSASQFPLFMSYRFADAPRDINSGYRAHDTSWKSAGSIPWLDNGTDFTGAFQLTGLKPDTRYQYASSNNHSGYFVTAPEPGHVSPRRGNKFTFLHSSCIKPRFPYNPLQHALEIPGFKHLAKLLPDLGAQFMIFLGDFIYIDVPKRLGKDIESYRREYRQVYASADWPSVSSQSGAQLPWIHVLDDHEIANDWDGNTSGVYGAAVEPWHHYHSSVNPPPVRLGNTYYSFTQGPASFFMLDTRRYRDPFDGTDGSYNSSVPEYKKSMLGEQQLADLLKWLSAPEPSGVRWKIVITSVPFTKNWRFGWEDTWAGYLGERQRILEAMWDVGLRGGTGVVVLSGDRHEFAATAFPPPPEGKTEGFNIFTGTAKVKRWPVSATVHEFSASPLSMFWLPYPTYDTKDDEDVCIKYIPQGNSKFGALTINTPPTSDQSLLHYRLFVDGAEAWSHTITTPPAVHGGGRSKDALWA